MFNNNIRKENLLSDVHNSVIKENELEDESATRQSNNHMEGKIKASDLL